MLSIATDIPDVIRLQPEATGEPNWEDYISFDLAQFQDILGVPVNFVQESHSASRQGVLRGLHYQIQNPQGKLIRVIAGAALDVAVDLRRNSPTFGQHVCVELTAKNLRQLWIPPGFAHGFQALQEGTEMLYRLTNFWSPQHERIIRWDDPVLGIPWHNLTQTIIAEKDACGSNFLNSEVYD